MAFPLKLPHYFPRVWGRLETCEDFSDKFI